MSSFLYEGFGWSSGIFGVFECLNISMLFVVVDLLDFEESVNLIKVRIFVSFVDIFVIIFLLDKNIPEPLLHFLIINKFVNSTSLYILIIKFITKYIHHEPSSSYFITYLASSTGDEDM